MPALPSTLKYADFRVLLASAVLGGIGFRGQLVAVGWILLEKSDSPLIVGLGIGAFLAPNTLLGILGGAVIDRLDRRLVLRLASLGVSLNTLILGLLTLHSVEVWQVILLTTTGGAIWSLIQTSQPSYTYDIVGAEDAARGLAIVSLAMRVGGVIGALATGAILSTWGPGEAYLALAAAHLLSSLTILLARSKGQAAPASTLPVWENVREYAGELKRNRTLAWLIVLTAAVEVFGFSHLSALPVLIRDELGGDGGDLGLVSSLSSVGGIIAILAFSARADAPRKGLAFLAVLAGFGLSIILLGTSTTVLYAIFAAALVSGFAALSDVLSQVLVQLAVPNEMRGRAMGTWALAIGVAPLGHLQMGALIDAFGAPTALAFNGLGLIIVALAASLLVGRIRRL